MKNMVLEIKINSSHFFPRTKYMAHLNHTKLVDDWTSAKFTPQNQDCVDFYKYKQLNIIDKFRTTKTILPTQDSL